MTDHNDTGLGSFAAAVLTANGSIEIQERELSPPKPDECRIRVSCTGVCSSDIKRGFGGGAYFYPLVMGHEFAGEIESVGSGVRDLRANDRVVVFPLVPCFSCLQCDAGLYMRCEDYGYYGSRMDGAYAEYINVKAWNILPVGEKVALEDAALIEPCAVVLHALSRLHSLDSACRIAVVGSGFLGLVATELFTRLAPEAEIKLIGQSQKNLGRSSDSVTVVCVEDVGDYADKCVENGDIFDVVLEAAGSPATFTASLRLAGPGGQVIWMGNVSGDVVLPRDLADHVVRRELTVRGTWNSGYAGCEKSDWTTLLEMMSEGFRPSMFVNRWATLKTVGETLQELFDHKAGAERSDIVKAMVRVTDPTVFARETD